MSKHIPYYIKKMLQEILQSVPEDQRGALKQALIERLRAMNTTEDRYAFLIDMAKQLRPIADGEHMDEALWMFREDVLGNVFVPLLTTLDGIAKGTLDTMLPNALNIEQFDPQIRYRHVRNQESETAYWKELLQGLHAGHSPISDEAEFFHTYFPNELMHYMKYLQQQAIEILQGRDIAYFFAHPEEAQTACTALHALYTEAAAMKNIEQIRAWVREREASEGLGKEMRRAA